MSSALIAGVRNMIASRRSTWTAAAVALAALGLCAGARASFKSLGQKLPASSNAVVAVNVAKVLQTPYAQTEWTPITAESLVKTPMMIPPGSTRLLMAAEIQTSTMESYWEMSLMEMEKLPSVQTLAKDEGGHIDRVWDKDAVCSPINAYFVPLDGNVLASITPANRAAITKWVRTPAKPEGNITSEYLQGVVAGLSEKTDIVMAMDLEGAVSVPNIRRWLDQNEIKEINVSQLDDVARAVGKIKGITLTIGIDKDVQGRGVVEFDADAAALKDCARPIMLELLNAAGMRIDDLQEWTFNVSGKRLTMEGKLSTPALRKLLSLVQSPIPAATVAQPAGAPAGQPDVPTNPAEASQRYYKVVCANLDNFRPGTSAAESATWARAAAKRIEQLPILNVDPQLVEWGAMVSLKLKQAGGGMAVGQTQIRSRVAGVMDPTYDSYTYDNEGNYQSVQRTGEMENAARQRRQIALEQKALAQEQALRVINEIAETRPAIRSAMVEKYKVEF